jgi:hypothetical protein
VACAEFTRLAPSSPHFISASLTEVLRQVPSLATDVRQSKHDARRTADAVNRLLSREDEDVVSASRVATEGGTPLGRPVIEWTSADLGVHATIVVDGLIGLTPYIPRPHDAKLRETLTQLTRPGAGPRLVTVVGTSCAGKIRALYEAVR